MSSEILRARLLNLLLTDSVRKIDFVFGSFHVDFGGFMSVWSMIATGAIDVVVGHTAEGDAAAGYKYASNRFLLPGEEFGATPNDQSVLVHESVHAMRDVRYADSHAQGIPDATWSEDEATGYIAGALFKLYAYPTADRADYPIFNKAYAIAGSLKDRPGSAVSDEDAMAMRQLIAHDRHYTEQGMTLTVKSGADGL